MTAGARADAGTSSAVVHVTTPARTVLDCSRHLDRPWALAVADAARRLHRVAAEQLLEVARRHPCDPAHRTVTWAAPLAVRDAESPLESLARAVVVLDGHPAPRVQVWLRTARGDVRVDLPHPNRGWPDTARHSCAPTAAAGPASGG